MESTTAKLCKEIILRVYNKVVERVFKEPTMHPEKIIQTALSNGRAVLSEYESKLILSQFDIPVSREVLVNDPTTAVDAAVSIGYPVALKACGARLMHKSDQGLVALNLNSAEQVKQAYRRIVAAAGSDAEGMLVQEMVKGMRELVVGLTRDAQFGPCVMLGLGGVMTEIYKDTVFRMAPVCRTEAGDMISQLRAKKMLGAFRGQQPADPDVICRCIMGVGRIGMQLPDIAEIDINPLIISGDGRITAVDALIILKEAK